MNTFVLNIDRLTSLENAMKICPQTKNQSVWEHGESVRNHLSKLIAFLRGNEKTLEGWKLPNWIFSYRSELMSSLASDEVLEAYTLYHDCGKPFCRTVDEEGKQHFPDHAKVSYARYLEVFDGADNCYEIAELIAHDMDIHTMSSSDIEVFCKLKNATSLLLAGIAEIHSNAAMFGGIESVSFKIKWKQIDKRGKAICEKLFGKKGV